MAGNSLGHLFRITTFGESHGEALGVVIDGCPPRIAFDFELLAEALRKRKPGQSDLTSPRKEADAFEVLSGVFEGQTTGTPICILIRNSDQQSTDYDALKSVYRPSHADYTYSMKYGIRDHRGSGRASARETVARVAAGAVATMLLKQHGILVHAYVSQVGSVKLHHSPETIDPEKASLNWVRCPDEHTAADMIRLIEKVREEGDSVGGTITGIVRNVPPGLGEPVFDKLHADLGKAMLSINACKGFEIGSGFEGSTRRGSEENDAFVKKENRLTTLSNHSGGIQGGISNGEPIYFRCAFKPVSSIKKEQTTLNTALQTQNLAIEGRHDPCVLPRAVAIVEAMTALTLADHWMRFKAIQST